MPSMTDAVVRVLATGQSLRADCVGNNAAVECPSCTSYPVLLIFLRNQRGSDDQHPAACRRCGTRIFILNDLNVPEGERLQIVDIAILPPIE